ncbi:MAG: hypothetical protein ACE5F1_19300 [Planctomycetota bacterium]
MPRRLPLSLLLASALLSCDQERPDASQGNGWLRLTTKAYHDFGEILHGERPSYGYRMKNASGEKIVLRDKRNSCNCGQVELRVLDAGGSEVERTPPQGAPPPGLERIITWLDPGQSLEVVVTIDSQQRPPENREEKGQLLLLFSPEGVGTVRLGYRFFVKPRLLVFPGAVISFPGIAQGQKQVEVIDLVPTAQNPEFEILDVKVDGGYEDVVYEELAPQRPGSYRFMVTIGPLRSAGMFERSLLFRTDLPGGYVLPVKFKGFARDSLELAQLGRLDFGRWNLEEPRDCELMLRYNVPGRDPELEVGAIRVRTDSGRDISGHFEPRIEPRSQEGGERQWALILGYKGGLEDAKFTGSLLLLSADRNYRETEIPISGYNQVMK